MAKNNSEPALMEAAAAEHSAGGASGETAQEDPRADVRIYIGPTMHRRSMIAAEVYRSGLSGHVQRMIEKVPEIAALIVPISEVVGAKRRVKEPGTTEHGIYQYLLSVRFNEAGEVRV